MLSDNTIRRINDQIQDELRTVDSLSSTHQEKMEAIERITALKALFDTPVVKTAEPTHKPIPELNIDFGRLFRR
jgi:beta-phosphoglucomutase-like phosphatase (HAD superfamily)